MLIGIAGMFLAPLGMLISKWAALSAFVDSGNIILILIICFGSAATLFYWTKWMGKMTSIVAGTENIEDKVHREEWFTEGAHAIMTVLLCIGFPLISKFMLVPYLDVVFGETEGGLALTAYDMIIMCIMIGVIVLMFAFMFGKSKKRIVPIYLSGVNKGDNVTYEGSMQKDMTVSLRNWYMDGYFGEAKMNLIGGVATGVIIIVALGMVAGTIIGGM